MASQTGATSDPMNFRVRLRINADSDQRPSEPARMSLAWRPPLGDYPFDHFFWLESSTAGSRCSSGPEQLSIPRRAQAPVAPLSFGSLQDGGFAKGRRFILAYCVGCELAISARGHKFLTLPGHYNTLAARRMTDAMMVFWPCVLNDGQIHDQ